MQFRAVELDMRTNQRTGETRQITAVHRAAAMSVLVAQLVEEADPGAEPPRVGPTGTLVLVDTSAWTIVEIMEPGKRSDDTAAQRRAGPLHRRT